MINIRLLDARDAGDYRAIRLAALASAPEAFGSTHAEEAARPLSDFGDRVRSTSIFGAFAGSRIIGMAGFKPETGARDRHKGFLWGMFVDPAARGQGVGAALVTAVAKHAATIVEQVTLTVVADNLAAIALYERHSFTAYGVEPRALKTETGYADEVLMVRFLR